MTPRSISLTLVWLVCLWPALARAAPLVVYLARPATDPDEAVHRIFAELQSEGYLVRWTAPGLSPCADSAAPEPAGEPSAWISVEDAASSAASRTVTLCLVRAQLPGARATVSAATGDPRQLALATVEALEGLVAEPRAPQVPRVEDPVLSPVAEALPSAFLVAHAALALEATSGESLLGAGVGLGAVVIPDWSLVLDAFVPFDLAEVRGEQRTLRIGLAWVRLGPRWSLSGSPFAAGISVQGGVAQAWASARIDEPMSGATRLLGTTRLARSALVSAGGWVEYPGASDVYVRFTACASRLLPAVELALGGEQSELFGALLLDLGIGIGLRWGQAAKSRP